VDHLNTYKPLQEDIFFASLENKVLNVLSDGKTCAWLERKETGYVWAGDYPLHFDILANCSNVRSSILGDSLLLSFKNKKFMAELCSRQRIGGYKDPINEIVLAKGEGHSLWEALMLLDLKLRGHDFAYQPIKKDKEKVVNMDAYKRSREKKKRN